MTPWSSIERIAGSGLTLEPEQSVGVVLDHQDAVGCGNLQDPWPAFERERHACRVVEVRHRVEQLDAAPRGAQQGQRLLERLGDQAVLVHLHVVHVGLVRAEHPERADVGRRLGHHHVAGIDEHSRHQVQALLRARRDHHVVGVGGDALHPHDVEDLLPEGLVALAGAVLQRRRTAPQHELVGGLGERLEREALEVRHPTRQRDHLGSVGDREQRADLRGAHAVGALGVGAEPRIERPHPGGGGAAGGRRHLPRRREAVIGHDESVPRVPEGTRRGSAGRHAGAGPAGLRPARPRSQRSAPASAGRRRPA